MSIYVGFDPSSKTIGFTAFQDNNGIIPLEVNCFQPLQEDLLDDLLFIGDNVKQILNKHNPDYIGIEQIIQFMKGKSTAQTITKLAGVNRLVCYLCYEFLKNKNSTEKPVLLNVLKIRHALKLSKALPTKEDMPSIIEQRLNIKFPYKYIYNKRTKTNIIDEVSYDMSDSFAVALTHYYINNPQPKIIKSRTQK
jgi:Holliday junction resolvasome RuvABC endonuclease subunit